MSGVELNVVLKLINSTIGLFSDERRRKFEKGLKERLDAVEEARMKRFPFFSDAKVRKAIIERDNYLIAHAEELQEAVAQRQVTNA